MEIESINLLKNVTLVGKRYFPTQVWLHLMDIQFMKMNRYFNLYCYIIISQKYYAEREDLFWFSHHNLYLKPVLTEHISGKRIIK